MTKRALLIGSQTYGLSGANPDVELLRETLAARGFECDVRIDDAASRRGIVEAYERLIADTPQDSEDPVVVYYSGHGGRTPLPDWENRQRLGQRSHLRYLVPFDMQATTETDFRGLLAEEISALQRRLTARTANVTTILDCCHSGTMSRDVSVMPKAVAREFSIEAAMPLLEELDTTGGPAQLDEANPLAVRLVACDPLQSAYERASSLGGRHGALTEAFVLLLRELGDRPLTWRVAADRLRRSITTTLPMQRPEVEGPADRILFSLAARSDAGALPVTVRDDVAQIDSARLFGISVGDTYNLKTEDDSSVGTASVTAIANDHAVLEIDRPAGGSSVNDVVVAVPIRTTRTRPVLIDVKSADLNESLRERVAGSTMLHEAGDGEPPLASIVERDGLDVLDAEGFDVQSPFAADASGVLSAVTLVERIAKAERVRALASSGGDALLTGQINVELITHDERGPSVRARTGERLYVGERISVAITNNSGADVYVGLLDIDTAYNVKALNADEPSGWRLKSGEAKVVGGEDGVGLVWDAGVPDDGERPETLMVVASTSPVDFRLLETPKGVRAAASTELDSLLQEANTGQRGFPATTSSTDAGYRVEAVDFYLVPGSKPVADEPAFAIRELPDVSLRAIQPRAAVAPPARVAVRLVALKVLQNRALFKAAVRVDALTITGHEDNVVATPFTYRFPSIADGDLLPQDNVPLFLGPVKDFLDIAIWLNRDDSKGKDLTELFEEKVKSADVKDALTVAGGLILAAPHVALAVGGVVAVATIVRVSAELVNAAVGKEIGLYRTSFLPFEQLGVGRHPAEGLRRAQGIEFAFEVVDPG